MKNLDFKTKKYDTTCMKVAKAVWNGTADNPIGTRDGVMTVPSPFPKMLRPH